MSDDNQQSKPTIWTGAATTLPVLSRLDLKSLRHDRAMAKQRVLQLHARIKRDLAPFAKRSTEESLRKLVK